ncbi:EAL domain-containing protein [Rahnella sp. R3(2024)]|uniref:EAL domain-containing protein n=1 Tax=Rahnella sp. R3(2024) TaxID=3163550 RepID=UPI0036E6B9A7
MKTAKPFGQPLFILFSTVLVAALTLVMTHFAIAAYDRDDLASYARHIMARGLEVADESHNIVSNVNSLRLEPCSDRFLDEIRYLSFTSVFISDIGYTQDHQLKCTAMRGRLPEPVTMSVPDAVTLYGQRIWTSFSGIVDPRITADMMESRNVLLFPTPAAFRDIYVPYKGFGAVLTNHQHNHVFRLFGETAGLVEGATKPGRMAWSHRAFFTECSKKYDICVLARNTQIGIFSLPVTAIVFIILAGLVAGGMFTFALVQYVSNNRSMQNKLKMAISHDDIYINFQPFIEMSTGKVMGYEALARWKDTHGDNIPPDIFIKLAESTHQIKALTRSVVSRALKDIGPHLRHNKALFVSINITTADVTDPDFKVFLEEELDNAGVERQQIVLEITERSTADHRVLKDALVRLREYGYRIALDDFGTGYSNLDYLSKLSFDFIKIDKIFTDAIGTESVSFNMLKMMLEMLTHTGATIIVEGIEEQLQADFLLSHSPTVVGQGWLYGRPVEVEKL